MCGICGFVDLTAGRPVEELRRTVRDMAERIRHRGPDDSGEWLDSGARLAFGHRRLSIVDLSAAGRQPMSSADGRYVIAYNGEIYNHLDLRTELERAGHRFRGHSDTEVILEACSEWGFDITLELLNGMFAFALWDREERVLHFARDRLGKKPLYYGWQGRVLLFGSELKALRAHPAFDAEIDRDALALYLRLSYVPAPYCIYRGIAKLAAGSVLSIDDMTPGELPSPRLFWSARAVAEAGIAAPAPRSEQEAIDALESLLMDAVGRRLVADVPLGALLSGGIDSSTVVALMQAQATRAVKTFTIGYETKEYNEAEHALAIATHLGTDHEELYVSPRETIEVIPRLPSLYDEPFADASQVPTFLISELARRSVTVALSGDGGDELFAGYNRYLWGTSLWGRLRRLPPPLRRLVSGTVHAVSPARWDRMFELAQPLLPEGLRQRMPGEKLYKLVDLLECESVDAVHDKVISIWDAPHALVRGGRAPGDAVSAHIDGLALGETPERMMFLDLVTYLPDDLLVKIDRASMGVSFEVRCPLLDHRVVEFAWRMPLAMKIRANRGKWLLRQVLYRHVPSDLVDRPKMGFAVPIDDWLRGPLKDWASSLIEPARIATEGYLESGPIRSRWEEHQSGRGDWQYPLWSILMFQAWLDETRNLASAPAPVWRESAASA